MVDRGSHGPDNIWTSTNPHFDEEQRDLSAWRPIPSGGGSGAESGADGAASNSAGPHSRIRKQNSTAEATEKLPQRLHSVLQSEHNWETRPLSVAGTKLDAKFRGPGDAALPWGDAVWTYKSWLASYSDKGLLVRDTEGNTYGKSLETRFHGQRAKKDYARLHNLHEAMEECYGGEFYIAFLTFTLSSRNERGGWRCPADAMRQLQDSSNSSMQALRRSLSNQETHRVSVIEPQKSGYPHKHIAVFSPEPFTQEDFEPVIDSHVRNTPSAGVDAHQYDRVIDVRKAGEGDGEIQNIAYYLSEYIAESFKHEDPLDAPEHVHKVNTVLAATNCNRLQFSDSANQLVKEGYEIHTGQEYPTSDNSDFEAAEISFDNGETWQIAGELNGSRQRMVPSKEVHPAILDPEKDLGGGVADSVS